MLKWRGSRDGNGSSVRRCAVCREKFTVYPHQKQRFCSHECGYKYNTQTRSVNRRCRECGKTFRINKARLTRTPLTGTYCSKACCGQARIKQWRNVPQKGRGNRRADQEWRLAVRVKDDYTCRVCGVKQQYIHTHHVATRARRPDLKHVVANGSCLCNSCHTWVHHHPREAVLMGLLSEETYELAASRKRHEREKEICQP